MGKIRLKCFREQATGNRQRGDRQQAKRGQAKDKERIGKR